MPRFENSDSPRLVEARFNCARGGREAAHLTLVPGTAGPRVIPQDMFRDLGHRPVIDADRLSLTIGVPGVLDDSDSARTSASADHGAILAVLDVAS